MSKFILGTASISHCPTECLGSYLYGLTHNGECAVVVLNCNRVDDTFTAVTWCKLVEVDS